MDARSKRMPELSGKMLEVRNPAERMVLRQEDLSETRRGMKSMSGKEVMGGKGGVSKDRKGGGMMMGVQNAWRWK